MKARCAGKVIDLRFKAESKQEALAKARVMVLADRTFSLDVKWVKFEVKQVRKTLRKSRVRNLDRDDEESALEGYPDKW